MATEPYHEARENDGLLHRSASADDEGRAAKKHWLNASYVDIKCLQEAGYRRARADRIAYGGDSKLETRKVRNNLIQWRDQPTVSAYLIELYMNNASPLPPPLLPFTQHSLLLLYCLRIVSTLFYSSIVIHLTLHPNPSFLTLQFPGD